MQADSKRPKVWILTKNWPFQRYCISKLYQTGILEGVIFEHGTSFAVEKPLIKRVFSNYKKWGLYLRWFLENPPLFFKNLLLQFKIKKYYGQQEFYNNKILGQDHKTLPDNLKVLSFPSINSLEAINFIKNCKADLIFVFGTSLLKAKVFLDSNAIFVNMHWGWSPDYRGEGIVTALAYGGPSHLGVTIHLIDQGADSGDILYQERPVVDASDNFYSIGLKITVIGTKLFLKVAEDFMDKLNAKKQDLTKGKAYFSKYLKNHPEVYDMAWKHLKEIS